MNVNYLSKFMFVNYNDKGFFQTTILLETNNGIIPYNYEKTDFISSYPYLAKRLMDGKTLYVAFDYGYVGIKKTEGPYCERQVFESEYEEKNIDFNELLISLDDAIKNEKKIQRKLIKIGASYK